MFILIKLLPLIRVRRVRHRSKYCLHLSINVVKFKKTVEGSRNHYGKVLKVKAHSPERKSGKRFIFTGYNSLFSTLHF